MKINENDFVRLLNQGSRYPIIGSLAGVGKVLFGTAKLVQALAYGILSPVGRLLGGDWSLAKNSWNCMKSGAQNIFTGILVTIPGVGFLIYKEDGYLRDELKCHRRALEPVMKSYDDDQSEREMERNRENQPLLNAF